MIEPKQGNLLEADAEALVNTVNCVGVMGKGVALQFKQAFPDNFHAYARACRAGEVRLGAMFIVDRGFLDPPRYIVNFPTKRHWKGRSRIDDIRAGLVALVEDVQRLGIESIAVPPLGCGNGGLDWTEVRPLIESAFAQVPDVRLFLYAPEGAPRAEAMPVSTGKTRLSRARALLLRLLDLYHGPGYRSTMLEVQKLAYFLQAAGEHLQLRYVKQQYGPYAENLNYVVQHLEGHYLRGYGDRSRGAEIFLLPGAVEAAREALSNDPEADERLTYVARLIDGFETPYGMELLATVYWVAQEDPAAAADLSAAIEGVHAWSDRKRRTFKPEHIRKAWQRLHEQGWLAPAASP